MSVNQRPLAYIGDIVEVERELDNASKKTAVGIIRSIKLKSKEKHGSAYQYSIYFGQDDVLKTRLTNLNFRKRSLECPLRNIVSKKVHKYIPPHKLILAPMVGASELAFRLLCRRYGTQLAYTPMMNSELFAVDSEYRNRELQTCPEDRPLVAHFCGNNAATMLAAAKYAEPYCDAIDLNLGCPQRVAFTGHFGSYLLDEADRPTVLDIVSTLAKNLSIPIFVKIRLLDSIDDTIRLCKQLEEAGAALIAIHGRYRVNLVGRTGAGARDGPAHLDQICAVKCALPNTPIIANGNIITQADVLANLACTAADGVMSAEGILNNPAIYHDIFAKHPTAPPPLPEMALEYLDLADAHPVKMKSVIFHTRRMLKDELEKYQLLQDVLDANDVATVRSIVQQVIRYRDNGGYVYDAQKQKKYLEAKERRAREEGKRKEYEKRMMRKAKREGKEPDYYLRIGSENPTTEIIEHLKSLSKEEAFEIWKQKHSQHCYAFHFDKEGCKRERTCAFLHADAKVTIDDGERFG